MLKMILLSFVLPVFTGAGVLAFGWLCPPLRKVRWIFSRFSSRLSLPASCVVPRPTLFVTPQALRTNE